MEESLVKAHHPTIDPKDPSDVMNEKDQHHDDNNLKKSVTIATTSIEKQTTADVSIHDSKELSSKPCRVVLSVDDLNSMDRSILIDNWNRQQEYVQVLEHRLQQTLDSKEQVVELEQKLKQQLFDSTRRENILIMKLTKKEQEMQDCINQIQELKSSLTPSDTQLHNASLDPAINIMFEDMKKEVDKAKTKVDDMQSELSAWKFTPDSNTGKRLMAKCRLLYQENEELGKVISSGRIAKLEGDLALQKSFSEEMKKSQAELDDFLFEIDEDVEGMQSTIYYLQQQLKEAKEQIVLLQQDKEQLISGQKHCETVESKDSKDSKENELPLNDDDGDDNKETNLCTNKGEKEEEEEAQPQATTLKQEEKVHEETTLNHCEIPTNGIGKIKAEENGMMETSKDLSNEIETTATTADLIKKEEEEDKKTSTQERKEINLNLNDISKQNNFKSTVNITPEKKTNNGNDVVDNEDNNKSDDQSSIGSLSDSSPQEETCRKRVANDTERFEAQIGGGIDSIIRKHRRLESVSDESPTETS